MAFTILFLLVVFGFAVYVMTPEERVRLIRAALAAIRQLKDMASRHRGERDTFRDALRARTPWALVTPALIALNATIFVFMLFSPGALSDPQTLVGWGGNFGPRTTNGEWWRLVTTMFVHLGMPHLLVSVAVLGQLGLMLERLVGRVAFAAVYVASGVFSSLASLAAHPVAVSVGASGALFGIYGLLLASLILGMLHRSALTIPLRVLKRLAPAAVVFILYHMATDRLASAAQLAGFVTGFIYGLLLARGVGDRKPRLHRVAAAMAATLVIAVASAVPLRGLADVRPEIERVVAVEERTASAYESAVTQFRSGRITAEALAQLIERTIVPELHAASARLKALDGVPHQHQPLVVGAEEYLRLRDESWRLRTEGLRKTNMLRLREAERTERASLEALQRIRPANQK